MLVRDNIIFFFLFQFWSAYVPCDTQYKDAVRQTLEQIDVIHRLCQKYPETFMFATSSKGEIFRWVGNLKDIPVQCITH